MKYIDKQGFQELKKGDIVKMVFLEHLGTITKEPYLEEGELVVDIKFSTGPWKGTELSFYRQQIKKKEKWK